jgi:hypothetical protein
MFSALLLVDCGARVAAVNLDAKIYPATCAQDANTFDVTAADPSTVRTTTSSTQPGAQRRVARALSSVRLAGASASRLGTHRGACVGPTATWTGGLPLRRTYLLG